MNYFIECNGYSFLKCVVEDDKVEVFRSEEGDDDVYLDYKPPKYNPSKYTIPICAYDKPKMVFIGKSWRCEATEFSGGFGSFCDGNSILVHLKDNLYAFIGEEIYEFTIPKDDCIMAFFSPVGNNGVPYPTAHGLKNVYFLLDHKYISNEEIDAKNGNITHTRDFQFFAYGTFYDMKEKNPKEEYSKLENVKVIASREQIEQYEL